MLYRLYIGSNNTTHKLETAKATGEVAKMFEGFTISLAKGFWQGKPEKSLIIEIETTETNKVQELAKTLCKVLDQQAVGVANVGTMQFIS